MPVVKLDNRALIRISGDDASHFLQNLVTTNIDGLETGQLMPGALLTPQGKILFDFLIARDGENAFVLDVARASAADFVKRLTLYKMRAKVTITMEEQALVHVSWRDDSTSSQIDSTAPGDRDMRFAPAMDVRRFFDDAIADGSLDDWTALRVIHGVAEAGMDYIEGDAFPHDAGLDSNGGVGFTKGCYVGQEVVSRMQHRGTARRRILSVSASSPLPGPGTVIEADGKPIGALGSVAGTKGLAMVRIDKVKSAMDAGTDITACGVNLALTIPPRAHYTFPAAADSGD